MDELSVHTGFPGGNGQVDDVAASLIRFRPDLRDTEGDWFYWNFQVSGVAGQEVVFELPQKGLIGSLGPALSLDDGATWTWLGRASVEEDRRFRVAFAAGQNHARLAVAIPYTLTQWNDFRRGTTWPADAEINTLCQSRHGRAVPLVELPARGGSACTVVVTARQHACEAMANYALEGILSSWRQDGPTPRLRAVPFVDLDGVERGDQGKNRRPHDHNRDYGGDHLYPETRAIAELIRAAGPHVLVVDLHCPYLHGGPNELAFLVGTENATNAQAQRSLAAILERVADGLPFRRTNFVPFGTDWNCAAGYAKGKSLATWSSEQAHCRLASTVEIPYSLASGITVTPDTARRFGAALGRALREFAAPPARPR
ncbi:MAG: hypothetical protein AAGK14_00200 [Verrucomicrobiota bacterium]